MNPSKPPASRAVPAVTRAVRVLHLLRQADEPMSLSELSRKLEVVPSSCLHILRALCDDNLVTLNPATKRYRLGLGLLAFAAAVGRQNPFGQIVKPALDQIGEKFRVTTFAIERRSADELVVVAVSENLKTFSVRIEVGTTFPALASASGRCVAAYMGMTEARRRRLFDTLRWQNPPAYDDWTRQVDAVREKGYGVDAGNFFRGTTIISVPVAGELGPASRFLAAVGLTEQLSPGVLENLARTLKASAAALFTQPPGGA